MAAPSVFVSHSRDDKELRNFFTNIASRAGFRNYFMEWENLENEYAAARIADIIRSNVLENVRMVVVLLGQNLANPPTHTPQFTHNWVTYEVGVAAGCRKPVWVLDETNQFIDFPIPYVTDYYQYKLDDVNDLQRIGELIMWSIQHGPTKKAITRCPYDNCNAQYNLWNRYSNEIYCPTCRQLITFQNNPSS